jgi:hypothetical protein
VAHLASLRNLRRLTLNQTAVTVDGLAPLKGLKNLEALSFLSDEVPDYAAAVQKLATMFPRVTSTRIQGKALGKEHFAPLAAWRSLTHLAIRESELRDGASAAIGQLTGIDWLEIAYTSFSDSNVDDLLGLKTLKKLSLGNTKITDTGLLKLKALKSLKEVNVPGTSVSLEGMRALERENTGCKVTR